MKTFIQISGLFLLIILIVVVMAGCTSSPTFIENEPPSSKFVVKTDGYNNCEFNSPETRTLTTRNTRTIETSWSHEGKAGIGGKIPLGFFSPSLDVEAAITSHYGSKETRTWEDVATEEFEIEGNSHLLYVVYYKEVTQKGVIQIAGKEIAYEYPSELSIVGRSKTNIPCDPVLQFETICMATAGDPNPSITPAYEGLERTWIRTSPSNGEILEITVERQDAYLVFHVQTDCNSGPCDWGRQWACVWDNPIKITYKNLGFKETTLTFDPIRNGTLKVTAWDRFLNPPITIQPQPTEYIFR